MKNAKDRIKPIIRILRKTYPYPRTMLRHKSPFELLVATMLSAQCTDERINKITPALFDKYRTIADFAGAEQAVLEKEIHSAGFYRNKAKNIIGAAKKIMSDFGSCVPDSMRELITLPGVARKTANIVLSSSFSKAEGIAVDTHVRRVSQRLGLSTKDDPDKIEKDLMSLVHRKDWIDFNYLFVDHGRNTCQARKPLCLKCPIRKLCPQRNKEPRPEGRSSVTDMKPDVTS